MESFKAKFAPTCPYCKAAAKLVSGDEIYPYLKDSNKLNFWRCDPCDAHVGCHKGTLQPLGTPAKAELRRERMSLHLDVIDPLWKTAARLPCYDGKRERNASAITRAARDRTYAWMAERLGLSPLETHVGKFDLETCKRARDVLQGITYMDIRAWHNRRQAAEKWARKMEKLRLANDFVQAPPMEA